MAAPTVRRGMAFGGPAVKGVGEHRRPVTGPYAECWYDPDARCHRVALSDGGRAELAAWMAEYPHPAALCRKAWPRLYAACRAAGLTDDEVNSAAAVGVVEGFVRYQPGRGSRLKTVLAWGVRSAVNHLLRTHNAGGREVPATHLLCPAGGDGHNPALAAEARSEPPADDGPSAELARLVRRARLTRTERLVLRLRYGSGGAVRTHREVGAVLGVSKTAVQQAEARALARLRRAAGVATAGAA